MYPYMAWPALFDWMYTWRTSNRSHMKRFDPLVGGSLGPLLALAGLLDIPELINDLIVFVQNKEQAGHDLSEYLSMEERVGMAKGKYGPVEFQDLCDHWLCHSRNEKGPAWCQNSKHRSCREPNHRFGIDSFNLEHWTTGCASHLKRAKERRKELKEARILNASGRSQAEQDEAEKYEPSPAQLTCEHFCP